MNHELTVTERFAVAWRMLSHQQGRLIGTALGVAAGFFLAASQFGLLVGWINTNTALIRHAGADMWAMAWQTPAYDYGTAIPAQHLYQLRSVAGIERTEALLVAWNIWQRGDGRRVNVELIGLDDGEMGGPWRMRDGSLDCVHREDTVVVDELYLDDLGVTEVGDEFEMLGRRVSVGGISEGVRTFTASPFVFTSLRSALHYDRRFRDDEITYALGWCAAGTDHDQVLQEARESLPGVEILTTRQFAIRSAKYWMLETGVGLTVIITAVLGLAVGTLIVSQALFSLVHDNRTHYATLLALGFAGATLASVIKLQGLTLAIIGIAIGSVVFAIAAKVSAPTPIPLETTPIVYSGLIAVSIIACLTAAHLAVRRLFNIDPVSVFAA